MAMIDRISSLANDIRKKQMDEDYEINQRLNTIKSLAKDIQAGTSISSGQELNYANRKMYNSTVDQSTNSNSGFFKAGTLSDGYELWDISKGVLGSVGDITFNALKGVGGFFEGIADTGSYLLALGADFIGQDDYANTLRENAMKDTIGEWTEPVNTWLDNYSWIGDKGDAVAQAIGYSATLTALAVASGGTATGLGASPAVANTVASTTSLGGTFLSSMGNSIGEAYNEGATTSEAMTYGLLAGIAETGSEMLWGGLAKGTNALGISKGLSSLDDVVAKRVGNLFKENLFGRNASEWLVKAGFEGLEEGISGFFQGFAKYITYQTAQDGYSFKEILDNQQLLDSMVTGAIAAGFTQLPGVYHSMKTKTDYIAGTPINGKDAPTIEDIGVNTEAIPEEIRTPITDMNTSQVENITDKASIEANLVDVSMQISQLEQEWTKLTTTDTNIGSVSKERIEQVYSQLNDLKAKQDILQSKLSEPDKIKEIKRNEDVVKVSKANSLVQENAQTNVHKLAQEIDNDSDIPTMQNKVKINSVGEDLKAKATEYIEKLNSTRDEKSQIGIVTELSQAQKTIEDLASAFGKQVVFVTNADFSGEMLPTNLPDVLFINNKINTGLISNNGKNNKMLYVMGHELFHSLKATDSTTYNQFIEYVANTVTNEQIAQFMEMYDGNDTLGLLTKLSINGDIDIDTIRKNKTKYKSQYTTLLEISEEMTANEFGGMITDTEYMSDLASNNKSLFEKIVEKIKKLFKSLTKPIYNSTLTQYQISNIRKNFLNVINEVETSFDTTQTTIENSAEMPKVQKDAKTPQNLTDEKTQIQQKKEPTKEKPAKQTAKKVVDDVEVDEYGLTEADYIENEKRMEAEVKEKNAKIEAENKRYREQLEKKRKEEIEFNKSLKELAKKPIDTTPIKQPEIKTTQMSVNQRIEMFEKSIPTMKRDYNNTPSQYQEARLKNLLNQYSTYKSLGGTQTVEFLENAMKTSDVAQPISLDNAKSIIKNEGNIATLKEYFTSKQEDKKLLPSKNKKQGVSALYSNTLAKTSYDDVKEYYKNNPDIALYDKHNLSNIAKRGVEILQTEGETAIERVFDNTVPYTDELVGVAAAAMKYYESKGDIDNSNAVYNALKEKGTTSGQFIVSFKLLQEMSPIAFTHHVDQILTETIDTMQNSTDTKAQEWISNPENKASLTLTSSEKAWIRDMATRAQNTTDVDTRNRYYKMIGEYINNKKPSTLASKLKVWRDISLLGNIRTQSRNMISNVGTFGLDRISKKFSSLIDYQLSKLTGKQTIAGANMQVSPDVHKKVSQLKNTVASMKQGIKASIADYKAGVGAFSENIDVNTSSSQVFNESRPVNNSWDALKNQAGHTLNELGKLTYGALDMGDRPFYQIYYNEELANQMLLKNSTEITEQMHEEAKKVADYKTYKTNSKAVRFAQQVKDALNEVLSFGKGSSGEKFGLGDFLVGYTTAPINIAVMTYEHSPVAILSVIKSGTELRNAIKTGNNIEVAQRNFVNTTSKMLTGSMFYVLGMALANMGGITGGEPDDKETLEALKATGWQKYSVKIGDTYWSYDWLGPVGNIVGMGAELTNKDDTNIAGALKDTFELLGNNIYEDTFINTIANILTSSIVYNSGVDEIVIDLAGDMATSLVPTALKQLADFFDPNSKLIYTNEGALGGALATLLNRILSRVPVAKSTLPTKYTTLGTEQKLYAGSDNLIFRLINSLFNPSTVTGGNMSEAGSELLDVYNTTLNDKVMPPKAPTSLQYSVNGVSKKVQFTLEEQSQLQQEMGTIFNDNLEKIKLSKIYDESSYEDKAEVLIALSQYAKTKALQDSGLVNGYKGNSSVDKYIEGGLSPSSAIIFDGLIGSIGYDYDSNGNQISGSLKGKKAYAIMQLNISDDEKNIMLDLMDNSTTSETVARLSKLSTIEEYIDYYKLSHNDYFIQEKFSRDDYAIATNYYGFTSDKFTTYATDISAIRSDYDSNGNVISNSKKNKIFKYINSLPLNIYQKIYLFHTAGYSVKNYKSQMRNYIASLDISASEKNKMWADLGY